MWANLGARLTGQEPGDVVVEAHLTADAHGFPTARGVIVHGGAIAALADMALASAGMSVADDGQVLATVDLRVDFLQAATPGRLLARGRVHGGPAASASLPPRWSRRMAPSSPRLGRCWPT